ncbi:MAG: hypothetical protein WKF86_08185 [Acidimicrobiales bacterium]
MRTHDRHVGAAPLRLDGIELFKIRLNVEVSLPEVELFITKW